MNFESPKKSSLENKSFNKNEKVNFSEFFREMYMIGRLSILGTFITLGLINPEQSTDTSPEDLISIKSYFNRIDSTQSSRITEDFDQMFNIDELHSLASLYSEDVINNIPQAVEYYKFILNPENRKRLVEIDNQFEISPQDLKYISDPSELTQNMIASPDFNTKILPKIKELRKLFSPYDNPSSRFIDLRNGFKSVNNPEYSNALKFVLDKTYIPYQNTFAHPATDILEIYNDPFFKKLASILDERNIYFNETMTLCGNKDKQEKFLSFLNDKKNDKILSLFDKKSPMGGYEMQIFADTELFERKWRSILENDDVRKKMNTLEHYGFTVRNLFLMQEKNVDKLIHDENYLKGFTFLLGKQALNDNLEGSVKIVESILAYYTDNQVELSQLESDFNSLTIEFIEFRKLSGLDEKLRLKKWETFKPVISRTTDEKQIHIDEFSQDPALQYVIDQLDLFKKVPACLKQFNPEQQKEWILRIARNMYISRIDLTMANFEQVFNETISVRNNPELLEQSLFKDRNVLVFAHNETLTDTFIKGNDRMRFGNEKTLNAIESQGTNDVYMVRSSLNTAEDLKEKKDMFFDYISTHKKLTVLVTAHGSSDGIFFTEGIPDKEGKIAETGKEEYVSPSELGMALEQRYDKGLKDTPIFIFESCYNHNYIRNLYKMIDGINEVKNKTIPYPIMCGSSEFGQFGYSDFNSDYRDKFIEAILDGKKDTKIKDLIEIEAGAAQKGIITNVSLFVPVPEIAKEKKEANKNSVVRKKYYQIAEVDENKIQQNHMQQYAKSVLDGLFDNQTASYFEQVQPKTAKSVRELLNKKETNSVNENIT